ncbi:MAG TPA: hypothetical protein VMV10_13885 [Pirellulales bacterium]|nr:hypothetical protein [Pirellulales bacterium]
MRYCILMTLACCASVLSISNRAMAADRALLSAPVRTVSSAGAQAAGPQVRLMSREREATLRRAFPRVNDPQAAALLADPQLVLYTETEMPKAYQFWDGMFPGVHSAEHNISANGREPHGNGNREFPWGAPAGTHRARGVSSFRFFRLPQDAQGRVRPVVWFRQRGPGDRGGYAWTFPVGTVFGEVLALRGPDGRDYTFELRTRTRNRGYWSVDAFRPFPTAESLSARIKELRPDWQQNSKLAQLVSHLDTPKKLPVQTLADRMPAQRVFQETMGVDNLPPVDDDKLIVELLTGTTFRSAAGEVWRGTAGSTTCAPTTSAKFHVVPAGYDAGFISIDDKSCMRCHDSVNLSVDNFDYGRDWYGRIRGSDGIFSFHPFSLDSISPNGFPNRVSMRSELEQAGLLEPFDARRHPNELYQSLVND